MFEKRSLCDEVAEEKEKEKEMAKAASILPPKSKFGARGSAGIDGHVIGARKQPRTCEFYGEYVSNLILGSIIDLLRRVGP